MKNFVEFLLPGTSLAGQYEKEILNSDGIIPSYMIPTNAFAYRFFQKNDGDERVSTCNNLYYLTNTNIYSLEEFKVKYPQVNEPDLFTEDNIAIVKTCNGFYPLKLDDRAVAINFDQEIINDKLKLIMCK